MAFSWKENCTTIYQRWVIFKQDTILSRQETRLNPIKCHSSSWRWGNKQNYGVFMIISQTGSYDHITDRILSTTIWRGCQNTGTNTLYSCPSVLAAPESLNHKCYTKGQTLGQEDNSRQWSTVSLNMWWKGQYSTCTQFCYLVRKKRRAKGKTQNQSHSWHPELSQLHQMFTLLWKRQSPVPTWHAEI